MELAPKLLRAEGEFLLQVGGGPVLMMAVRLLEKLVLIRWRRHKGDLEEGMHGQTLRCRSRASLGRSLPGRGAALRSLIWLVAIGALGACLNVTEPESGGTEIEIIAGDNQTAEYGKFLPQPIVVRVTVDGSPAAGVPVAWWVLLPYVAPHTFTDLCGYASAFNSQCGTTETDKEGNTASQWKGRQVEGPTKPQGCKMQVLALSGNRDSVVAVGTVYARWEYVGS